MDKVDLLKLEKIAAMTPAQIEKSQPNLFKKLGERVSINLKKNALEKVKKAPKDIKDTFAKLDLSPAKIGSKDLKFVLNKALNVGRTSAKRKEEIKVELAKLPALGTIDSLLQPDVPILINPVFQPDLIKAKVFRLADITGLSQNKVENAMKKGLTLNTLSNEKLGELVKSQTLTDNQAKSLGLTANLYALFDSNFELTEFASKGNIPRIRGNIKSLQDLISLDKTDWGKLVADANIELPDDLKPQDYAEVLYKKVENLFPSETLVHRVSKVDNKLITKGLTLLKPLLDQNEKVFGVVEFKDLKTDNLNAVEIKQLETEHQTVNRQVRLHPGLKIHEILNDKQLSIADRGKQVIERIGLFDKFVKKNSSIDYLSISYTHDSKDVSALDFSNFKSEEKAMVLNSAKSYQRIYSFTNDIEHTEAIMAAGYHSAYHITSLTFNDFVKTTKLDKKIAKTYFENAHETIIRTTAAVGSILDVASGDFNSTNVGNVRPSVEDYLKDIPGYQDLFGSLSFCDCEHCQSIFSPAAYFVDLMRFIERNVVDEHFDADKSNDVLNLEVRRPDLWELPLTCENTDTLVPYLVIINEILESYIANKTPEFNGDLSDRAAVEGFVYKQEIALELPANIVWKGKVSSFSQPFHLPLESLFAYLGHFEHTREDIAKLLNKSKEVVSKAKLNIAEKEFQLITQADITPTFLNKVYSITFTVQAGKIKPFDTQLLLKPMGLTRKELGRLINTQYVTNNDVDNIVIQGEKKSNDSIQNDIERVKNLTFDALDRAHRFVRLWNKTSWSIEELDLILIQLNSTGNSVGIDDNAVIEIGHLCSIQKNLNISVDQFCGLWGMIPTLPANEKQKSLFDTLFNQDDVVSANGTYPKDTIDLVHPALIDNGQTPSAESESNRNRLMIGLNRSDADVLALIKYLALPLGVINIQSAVELEKSFKLTLGNLSLLYRHSRMADILDVSIDELFQLIDLIDNIGNAHIENIVQLDATLEFHQWWKNTRYSLDELHFVTNSNMIVAPESFLDHGVVTQSVLDQIKAGNTLIFADTLFAYLDNITEEQSRAIIEANDFIVESSPINPVAINDTVIKTYWLNSTFKPTSPITIPQGVDITESELREELLAYHPLYLIPHFLSGQLGLGEKQILSLINLLGDDLSADAYILELQQQTTPAVALPQLIEKLIPLSVLFKDKKFDDNVLDYVSSHVALFEIASIDNISVRNIELLHIFMQLLSGQTENSFNISLLSDVLTNFTVAQQFNNSDQDQLATLLDVESTIFTTIHPIMGNTTNALVSLSELAKLAQTSRYIGIGGDILPFIVSDAYDDLQKASTAILAAFKTKYPSKDVREEKLEPYQDNLRAKKRASLTEYLIHSGFPQFENSDDLFNYFLIDTELEGCARTSRLVAATMSLQLYVHRILLNLEQDNQDPGVANKTHVFPSSIPAGEWEWRKNYRVWEANRKVFLYPESYIEPGLRDNKTPLFEELETELLQQDMNADTVLDAYAKYMRGFDEVAHLKIAGSFHEKYEETDVLHLFGVTKNDPPIFYYRTVDNYLNSDKNNNKGVVWGSWQKINVQVPVYKVSPIIFNGKLYIFWVRTTTRSKTKFEDNQSIFLGYNHKFSIHFSTLKLDGSWMPPQSLSLTTLPFSGEGIIKDTFIYAGVHEEPVEEYTLRGWEWDRVYPSVEKGRLILSGVGFQMRGIVDFYNMSVESYGNYTNNYLEIVRIDEDVPKKPGKVIAKDGSFLYRTTSPTLQLFDNYAYGELIASWKSSGENSDIDFFYGHWNPSTMLNVSLPGAGEFGTSSDPLLEENKLIRYYAPTTTIEVINGSYSDVIIDDTDNIFILQGSSMNDNRFLLKRLGTSLSGTLSRTLFTSGFDSMLSIDTQKKLGEPSLKPGIKSSIDDGDNVIISLIEGKIDFEGSYGTYYREIFFHIPFLIANHLNSQGKYEEAQKWYHYIFNPISSHDGKINNKDISWKYLEFRDIDAQNLKDQLHNTDAIETYKTNPFNPHAIARLRNSAYQKSIVMKYIDNLLDWGDQLFTQDTMESVNEATLLYVTAKEILGDHPARIGSCDESISKTNTYREISPRLNEESEFLAELEHYTFVDPRPEKPDNGWVFEASFMYAAATKVATESKIRNNINYTALNAGSMSFAELKLVSAYSAEKHSKIGIKAVNDAITGQFSKGTTRAFNWKHETYYTGDRFKLPSFGESVLSHISLLFCVPENKELKKYWDRVDDRLFKIRNCMSILGEKRQITLFSPEIDPKLLVRGKAAGLSLADILISSNGNLPPYRFSYIIERAKAYTSAVQSFGASLLSAIEKRDGEELAQIRILHQDSILRMTSKSRQLEISSANEGIKVLKARLESLSYQLNYYDGLISEGRNSWENAQATGRHSASAIKSAEEPLLFKAAISALAPQGGSPFALTYGGVQVSKSASKFASVMSSLSELGNSVAASTGLEAGFRRRNQGWKYQKQLIKYDLEQTEKNLTSAEIRRDILIESEKTHQKNIEHNNDVMEFYGDKFSNLGLYTWLSITMQRLFKEAYNNANAIAKLAEQAYQFERDDNTSFIDGNYFETPRAGLLAGERLFMGLQAMERRYLETNYRKNEIDQTFSITQLDPAALLLLKQTGECEFSIPEVFFDLFYPGQYRRKVQSVRLTIPSVTGPYINVSANLSLIKSEIRMEPNLGDTELKVVPKSRTTNIATSTAQNDAGVFQLNFNDNRYMPFEGAGVISSWKLLLPKSFRQFDYDTINDVMIHISYTAEYDELFRDKVEEQNDAIEGTLTNILKKDNELSRTFSFRQEFSTDFNRLIQQPINQPITIKIEDKHFPLFLNGKSLSIDSAWLILVTPNQQTVTDVDIAINGTSQTDFTKDPKLGDLFSKDLGGLFNAGNSMKKEHTIAIVNSGDLAPVVPAVGSVGAIDSNKLEDIILYVKYSLE